jgi:hypothetical protein
MFERYLLVRHDFQNVSQNGQIIGFKVKIRIPYYRGVYLSQIEGVKLKVNDEEFDADVMTFTVPAHGPKVPDSPLKTYTFNTTGDRDDSPMVFRRRRHSDDKEAGHIPGFPGDPGQEFLRPSNRSRRSFRFQRNVRTGRRPELRGGLRSGR